MDLLNNPVLTFYYSINPQTGEVRSVNRRGEKVVPHQKAYYKGILFKVFDTGRVVIEGSLHKYWNNGEHNFNDFDLINVAIVLNEFLTSFKIPPHLAVITELEIGFNITIPYPLSKVLHYFYFHKKERFVKEGTKTEGVYYQVKHKQYRIKVYDKSLQYRKGYPEYFQNDLELMRVEINWKGTQLRRLFQLKTVADLMEISFDRFVCTIKKEIESTLFYDYTIDHTSTRILNYANQNYWQKLIDEKSSSTYEKHQNKLKDYRQNHSENILKQIVEAIDKKSLELLKRGTVINTLCI